MCVCVYVCVCVSAGVCACVLGVHHVKGGAGGPHHVRSCVCVCVCACVQVCVRACVCWGAYHEMGAVRG